MFKWPGGPSPRAPEHELADFAELICWQQGGTSATALAQSLGRLAENEYSDGVPEEEEIPRDIGGAYQEIERRIQACDGCYPFEVDEKGNALYAIQNSDSKHLVYKYLLLATRLNMSKNQIHADIDGALLFEELSAETARGYLGYRAESMVFGTAAGTTKFPRKVDELCSKIGEGNGYTNRTDNEGHQKDGKLDVVLWKHFSDRLPGKFVAFGQCKTGTEYKTTLTQLQPESFCKKWMQSPPALTPMRMFFVAEALPRGSWYNFTSDAGLLFDRCRIVDFGNHVSQDILAKVEVWTAAAAKSTELPAQ